MDSPKNLLKVLTFNWTLVGRVIGKINWDFKEKTSTSIFRKLLCHTRRHADKRSVYYNLSSIFLMKVMNDYKPRRNKTNIPKTSIYFLNWNFNDLYICSDYVVQPVSKKKHFNANHCSLCIKGNFSMNY